MLWVIKNDAAGPHYSDSDAFTCPLNNGCELGASPLGEARRERYRMMEKHGLWCDEAVRLRIRIPCESLKNTMR
jgi:hypothetical protein